MQAKRKILISCINYNTIDKLNEYLFSIESAFSKHQNNFELEVLIGDNSQIFESVKLKSDKQGIKVKHIDNGGNFGYLGGVRKCLNEEGIELKNYDFLIISNVDVQISENFFSELWNLEIGKKVGWIAPSIFSQKEKRDRNPKIKVRPSVRKMRITQLFYKFPLLHFIYERMIYKNRKRIQNSSFDKMKEIYAGHGSFMIFTKAFLEQWKDFVFPSFLFGEEIYFAELVRKANLLTLYIPSLKVFDFDHASTAKLRREKYYRYNFESVKRLTNLFFKK